MICHLNLHSTKSTLIRTLIFTSGHYLIDASCTHFIGGADWNRAFASSIVGPILNAIWYFILDKIFFNYIFVKIRHFSKNSNARL